MYGKSQITQAAMKFHYKEYWVFGLILIVGALYGIFGHFLITFFYELRWIEFVSSLLEYPLKEKQHYLELSDRVFFTSWSCGGLIFIAHRLVYSRNKVPLLWVVLTGIISVLLIYFINPHARVYSYHGFIHAGIVNQILNGAIPPQNPFLSGMDLHYPWGYHLLSAVFSHLFKITPFSSFMIINMISLLTVIILIYLISRSLFCDNTANVLSVYVSLFSITFMDKWITSPLSSLLNVNIETRVTPLFKKFSNTNGVPLGWIFFLLSIYLLIMMFKGKKPLGKVVLLAVCVVCVGFFYPAHFFGLGASICLACLAVYFAKGKDACPEYRTKILMTACAMIACLILLAPFHFSISSGLDISSVFFSPKSMVNNVVSYFILLFPMLIVLFISRHFVWKSSDHLVLLVVMSCVCASFVTYVTMSLPTGTECKSLGLSALMMGILGGVAFRGLKRQCPKAIVFLLLVIFTVPVISNIYTKYNMFVKLPKTYYECGRDIHALDSEENAMYEWIQKTTPKNCVFIDTELSVPVFARRNIFIGSDKWGGPGFRLRFLSDVCKYNPDLLERRKVFVQAVYSTSEHIDLTGLEDIWDDNRHVYVIVRNKPLPTLAHGLNFLNVFKSEAGTYKIYRISYTN